MALSCFTGGEGYYGGGLLFLQSKQGRRIAAKKLFYSLQKQQQHSLNCNELPSVGVHLVLNYGQCFIM